MKKFLFLILLICYANGMEDNNVLQLKRCLSAPPQLEGDISYNKRFNNELDLNSEGDDKLIGEQQYDIAQVLLTQQQDTLKDPTEKQARKNSINISAKQLEKYYGSLPKHASEKKSEYVEEVGFCAKSKKITKQKNKKPKKLGSDKLLLKKYKSQ